MQSAMRYLFSIHITIIVEFREMRSYQKSILKSALHSIYANIISSNGLSRNSHEEQPLHTKPYEARQTYNRPLPLAVERARNNQCHTASRRLADQSRES